MTVKPIVLEGQPVRLEPLSRRILIDSPNERSRQALLRIGAKEEGTFRNHKVTASCRIRYKEGFSVSCAGLPGCWSQGQTEQEAIEAIQDAIREYLAAIAESTRNCDVREIEVTF